MSKTKLIADSGATKAEWCFVKNGKKKTIFTQGISPYFLNTDQIKELLLKELKPALKNVVIDEVYYYGTGCANPSNAKSVQKAIQHIFSVIPPGAAGVRTRRSQSQSTDRQKCLVHS